LLISFMYPVIQLVNLGASFQQAAGDMNRLDDVLVYPKDQQRHAAAADAIVMAGDKVKLSGHLEVRNLTFGYSRLEPPLIENFSLTVARGARVALVGASGSGKSTIARHVCGLFEPWEGQILFDGLPGTAIPRAIMTDSLCFMDQDIFLFEGKVRDNLTLWNPAVPDAEMVRAAKDACIHSDIAARIDGYDSLIEEGGRNLSGGQRQRLEIARALVSNPSILVLDEATSALDPETERQIDVKLRRRGCTCLIIAHRLSTIRDCNEIIVMEKGKVVQRGVHEDLVGTDGQYKWLIES